ncbi:MAG TPA: hypothetical protein VF796_01915 [Humisphaera sp.]
MTYTSLGSSGEFLNYPTNKVVGVFADWPQAKAALAALSGDGFAGEQVGVLYGPEGARRLDASGERHGILAQISRFFQRFADMDDKHTQRHEQELAAGHVLVEVYVGDDESARGRVRDTLRQAGGYFINFYGKWYVENLAP